MVYLMQNYVNYNLWANERLVNWLRTKPEEVVQREVPSSFPSIQKTLVHIWQTQRYWLSILRKRKMPQSMMNTPATWKIPTPAYWQQSKSWRILCSAMTDKDVHDTTLIMSPWFQSDFQNFEYIIHAVTHSTYHRGQIYDDRAESWVYGCADDGL